MIEYIKNFFINFNFLYFSLIVIVFFVVIYFWPYLERKINIQKYKGQQRIHENEIPRLGGVIIFAFIYTYVFTKSIQIINFDLSLLSFLCISSLPIFIIGFSEDCFQNTSPYLRLLIMFISATIAIIFSGILLPTILIPVLGDFVSNSILIYPFYIISVVIYMNGVNLIDGANGLMPLTTLGQLGSLIFLSITLEDLFLIHGLLLLTIPLIVFSLFNYPYGKIFIGDSGAYLYGFFIAIFTIIFFGRNPDLPSWGAVLILFFPLIEIFFSFFRKIFYEKISPFEPDSNHIHLKLFYVFSSKIKKKRVANGLVMPTLSLLWLSPCALITWFYDSNTGILVSIAVLIICYFGFYWALPRKELGH